MEYTKIKSRDNERLKAVRKLQQKKHRDQENLFLLEGFHVTSEAIANSSVESIYFTDDFRETAAGRDLLETAFSKNIPLNLCSNQAFKFISETITSQGILAVCHKPNWKRVGEGTILVLDELQDPGNLGTLIRTAVAAGVNALYLVEGSVDIYNSKVLRATMGAIFHLPHFYLKRKELIDYLKAENLPIVVADLTDAKNYHKVEYPKNLALVIGNEARGVHNLFKENADITVKIPILGEIESLNAAVAGGILLYEILRQGD